MWAPSLASSVPIGLCIYLFTHVFSYLSTCVSYRSLVYACIEAVGHAYKIMCTHAHTSIQPSHDYVHAYILTYSRRERERERDIYLCVCVCVSLQTHHPASKQTPNPPSPQTRNLCPSQTPHVQVAHVFSKLNLSLSLSLSLIYLPIISISISISVYT